MSNQQFSAEAGQLQKCLFVLAVFIGSMTVGEASAAIASGATALPKWITAETPYVCPGGKLEPPLFNDDFVTSAHPDLNTPEGRAYFEASLKYLQPSAAAHGLIACRVGSRKTMVLVDMSWTPAWKGRFPTLPAWVTAQAPKACPGGKLVGPLYGFSNDAMRPFIDKNTADGLSREAGRKIDPTPLAAPNATRGQVTCYPLRPGSVPLTYGLPYPGASVIVQVTKPGYPAWAPPQYYCPNGGILFASEFKSSCSNGAQPLPGPQPRHIGIRMEPLTDLIRQQLKFDDGPNGVVIGGVFSNTPASETTLMAGDVVETANDVPLRSPADLERIVQSTLIGTDVKLLIWSHGVRSYVEVRVDPAEAPSTPRPCSSTPNDPRCTTDPSSPDAPTSQ